MTPATPLALVSRAYQPTASQRAHYSLMKARSVEVFLRKRAIDRARGCKTRTAINAWVELARDHNRRAVDLRRQARTFPL